MTLVLTQLIIMIIVIMDFIFNTLHLLESQTTTMRKCKTEKNSGNATPLRPYKKQELNIYSINHSYKNALLESKVLLS